MNSDIIVRTQQHLLWFVFLSLPVPLPAGLLYTVNRILLGWGTAAHHSVRVCGFLYTCMYVRVPVCECKSALGSMMYLAHESVRVCGKCSSLLNCASSGLNLLSVLLSGIPSCDSCFVKGCIDPVRSKTRGSLYKLTFYG